MVTSTASSGDRGRRGSDTLVLSPPTIPSISACTTPTRQPLLDGLDAAQIRAVAEVGQVRRTCARRRAYAEEVLVARRAGARHVRGYMANTDLFSIMMRAYGWPSPVRGSPDDAQASVPERRHSLTADVTFVNQSCVAPARLRRLEEATTGAVARGAGLQWRSRASGAGHAQPPCPAGRDCPPSLVTPVRIGRADAPLKLTLWAQQEYSHLAARRTLPGSSRTSSSSGPARVDVQIEVSVMRPRAAQAKLCSRPRGGCRTSPR